MLGKLEIIYTFRQQKVVASFKVQNERYSVQLVLAKHVLLPVSFVHVCISSMF